MGRKMSNQHVTNTLHDTVSKEIRARAASARAHMREERARITQLIMQAGVSRQVH